MGGPRGRKKDPRIDQYKDVCPPQRMKELEEVIKRCKGDETAIMNTIQQWWDDPVPAKKEEEEWSDVNHKSKKKHQQQIQQQQQQQQERVSRGEGRGRGSRGRGRGGRGPSRGGGRSYDRRPAPQAKSPQPHEDGGKVEQNGPAPVTSAPPPKGAWGHRGAAPTNATAAETTPISSPVRPGKADSIPEKYVDISMVSPEDPTPSGGPTSVEKSVSAPRTPSTPTGNVWATKGSAHLIRAEKPKPPPPPPPPQMRMAQSVEPPTSPVKQSLEPKEMHCPEPPAATALESGLSPSLSGVNTGSWKAPPSLEMSQSTSSVAEAALGSIGGGAAEVVVVQETAPPMSPAQPQAPPPPTNVLNMGHWESGEGDDSQNLDFGFGSFGKENETAAEEPASKAPPPMPAAKETATAPAVSPARPPPGLSIGGMPPMPTNAVLVHELENKLESTSLSKAEEESSGPKPMTSNLPSQPPPPPPPPGHPDSGSTPNVPPAGGAMSQNYNAAYGMGMYNYNTAGSGFMGVPNPAGGPVLGVPPQQQKPQTGVSGPQQAPVSVSGGGPQPLPQQQQPPPGGLYGAAPAAGNAGDNANAPTSSTDTSTTAIPPGMPNAMPYNPALFYGQQPYQMGQPHGGVGYGYGYGAQFGGAAGFYQQQVMGQSGGYPSYDDQPPQGRGDYPSKSSNRYRNSGNQYQNQFNPQQHGGYGGQPYNMGYNVDHFNQRGGYGPPDPYGMQPQQQQGSSNYSGSFHDDDQHKGKKGGRNGGFQQHHQQLGQQQQQQPFLGGGGGGGESSSTSNQGWSNNNTNNNQGGWVGTGWQGGN